MELSKDVNRIEIPPKEDGSKEDSKPKKLSQRGRKKKNGKDRSDKTTSMSGPKSSVLASDETGTFKHFIEQLNVSTQSRAIQLSTTTRGVGFATVVFYTRVVTTWNLQAVVPICSIHQVYRVHLMLFYYKMHLAYNEQKESRASRLKSDSCHLSARTIAVLSQVIEMPSVFVAVLQSIGKIVNGDETYHSVFPTTPAVNDADYFNYLALVQTPDNIRTLLAYLATVDNPLVRRQELIAKLSVPGCHIEGDRLLNIDEVWPAVYTIDTLREDVHSYRNLITRVENRLPKSFVMHYSITPFGRVSGLMSTTASSMRIETTYRNVVAMSRSRAAAVVNAEFVKTRIVGASRQTWWCRDVLPNEEVAIGVAAMVGEELSINTRFSCVSSMAVKLNSIDIMYAINDAPRP